MFYPTYHSPYYVNLLNAFALWQSSCLQRGLNDDGSDSYVITSRLTTSSLITSERRNFDTKPLDQLLSIGMELHLVLVDDVITKDE